MSDDLSGWISDLTSPDGEVRCEAARQLAQQGPDAQPAAVDLARACSDENDEVRDWASSALEELGPPDPNDVPTLLTLLTFTAPDTAYWAATLLGRLQKQAAMSAPEIVAALEQRTESAVRERLVWALGQLGNPVAARCLKELSEDETNSRLARLATAALKQLNTW